MSKLPLDCIVREPKGEANACVIWLHGLGADGGDFADIVPQLKLPETVSARFIFPHAPIRPVSVNGGLPCRAWYDIYDLTSLQREDKAGIRLAEQTVHQLISSQVAQGIPYHRIILVGFSQGGAVVLYTALRHPEKLAGVVGLSSYLPLVSEFTKQNMPETCPVFLAHGQQDPVLPILLGKRSKETIEQLGYDVTWHEYAMEHQVCMQEIHALSHWLTRVLA